MSAPPLESSFFYRMATSLNKSWADWFTALGATQSGLGTMSTQSANAVAITGGTISGATITLSTGTFTPTIVSAGGGAPTYSSQAGTYTIAGDRVVFDAYVSISAFGTLAAGALFVGGLPFTPSANTSAIIWADNLGATAVTMLQALVVGGGSSVRLYKYSGGSLTSLAKSDVTATMVVYVSGSYKV